MKPHEIKHEILHRTLHQSRARPRVINDRSRTKRRRLFWKRLHLCPKLVLRLILLLVVAVVVIPLVRCDSTLHARISTTTSIIIIIIITPIRVHPLNTTGVDINVGINCTSSSTYYSCCIDTIIIFCTTNRRRRTRIRRLSTRIARVPIHILKQPQLGRPSVRPSWFEDVSA
jgi:hypothetical protein